MLPDIGQVVLYALTEEQAEQITRRRRESAGPGLGVGVLPGDAVPMLVAARASGFGDGVTAVAGRLLLDDDDDESWWVTSVFEECPGVAFRLIPARIVRTAILLTPQNRCATPRLLIAPGARNVATPLSDEPERAPAPGSVREASRCRHSSLFR